MESQDPETATQLQDDVRAEAMVACSVQKQWLLSSRWPQTNLKVNNTRVTFLESRDPIHFVFSIENLHASEEGILFNFVF